MAANQNLSPETLICPVTIAEHADLRNFANSGEGIYELIKKRAETYAINRDKKKDVLTVRDSTIYSYADATTLASFSSQTSCC